MVPIKFKQMNGIAAEDQEEYVDLPMHRTDTEVISCWKLTWKERLAVLFTGKVWLRMLCEPSQRITPSKLQAEAPFKELTDGT